MIIELALIGGLVALPFVSMRWGTDSRPGYRQPQPPGLHLGVTPMRLGDGWIHHDMSLDPSTVMTPTRGDGAEREGRWAGASVSVGQVRQPALPLTFPPSGVWL